MKGLPSIQPAPKWSLKTSFWFCVATAGAVAPTIILITHKTIWAELEIVTGVLGVFMFAYFTVILHQGVRFTRERRALINWPAGRPSDILNALNWSPDSWFFTETGAESGLIGIVLGFILDIIAIIVLSFLIGFLFWIGANAVIAIILFLFWVHARWLRYLMTKGRHCRGNWGKSVLHGGATTVRFMFWFYLAFFIAKKAQEIKLY